MFKSVLILLLFLVANADPGCQCEFYHCNKRSLFRWTPLRAPHDHRLRRPKILRLRLSLRHHQRAAMEGVHRRGLVGELAVLLHGWAFVGLLLLPFQVRRWTCAEACSITESSTERWSTVSWSEFDWGALTTFVFFVFPCYVWLNHKSSLFFAEEKTFMLFCNEVSARFDRLVLGLRTRHDSMHL